MNKYDKLIQAGYNIIDSFPNYQEAFERLKEVLALPDDVYRIGVRNEANMECPMAFIQCGDQVVYGTGIGAILELAERTNTKVLIIGSGETAHDIVHPEPFEIHRLRACIPENMKMEERLVPNKEQIRDSKTQNKFRSMYHGKNK